MLTTKLNDLLGTLCQRLGWQPVSSDDNDCFKLRLDSVSIELFAQGNRLIIDSPVVELSTDAQQRWAQINKVLQLMLINPDISRFNAYCSKQKDELRIFNALRSEHLDIVSLEAALAIFVDGIEWINIQLHT